MNTGRYATLRQHSEGKKYKPVNEDGRWHLVNDDGQYLVGTKGTLYNFASEENAQSWLFTNLSRMANKHDDYDIETLKQIGKDYIEHGHEHIIEEFNALVAFNNNEWKPVVSYGDCEHQETVAGYDGGNPYSAFDASKVIDGGVIGSIINQGKTIDSGVIA